MGFDIQRLDLEKNEDARAVMEHAQNEEFIHFGIDLEFLLRPTPVWRNIMKNILFKKGTRSNLQSMRKKQ